MTRINVIPPDELSDKHLGAEYRELPRIFNLVKAAVERGESPNDPRNPTEYVLGTGHVRFFYPRLGYLQKRFEQIVAECYKRQRKVSFAEAPSPKGIPPEWFGDWHPTETAIALNRQRILERS